MFADILAIRQDASTQAQAEAEEAAINAAAHASADNWGRVPKTTFLAVTGTLFGIMMAAFLARLYVRLAIQRQFSSDDIAICLGVASFIASVSILWHVVDELMISAALLTGDHDIGFSSDIIFESLDYAKWNAVALTVMWFSITCVKFSFLLLFRKLVDRIRPLTIYWWVVVVYTVIVFLGGITAYFLPCPYFYSLKSDIIGDCMILAIPVCLIWKIQIRWTQKLALASSLCLTIILIVATIVRVSGILNTSTGSIDIMWEVFWQVISTELGLFLSCALAFRSFFVHQKPSSHSVSPRHKTWYSSAISRARALLLSRRTGSKQNEKGSYPDSPHQYSGLSGQTAVDEYGNVVEMPDLPRATMTGMRTFIDRNGRTNIDRSQIMRTQTFSVDEEQWGYPTPTHERQYTKGEYTKASV